MKNNWNTVNIGTHCGLLDGTIKSHECDPLEDCQKCHGSGRCQKCQGTGDIDCHVCHGSGQCKDCRGQGSLRCTECGGSGRCRKCGGTGQVVCTHCHGNGEVRNPDYLKPGHSGASEFYQCKFCHGTGYVVCTHCAASGLRKTARFFDLESSNASGSGKCPKCEGTGQLICKTCNGTGECTSCSGSGKETCSYCHGSGNCTNCDGTGRVTCRRCDGSGWYQTFSMYETQCYAEKWEYFSSEELRKCLTLVVSRPVYKNIYRKWKTKGTLEFDRLDDVIDKVNRDFGNTESYKAYENAYDFAVKSSGFKDVPYEKSLEIDKIPATKIVFSLNGKEYSAYIVGDNGVVLCDELPIKIEIFKPSFFQRLIMFFTKKKRHLSYIKLAAYIFQCDGKSMEESHVLDVFVSALKLTPAKQDELKEQLKTYNKEMPYEVLRKNISSLFFSKKTLTFAWQCMTIDKNASSQEQALFDKLVAEYKLDLAEVELMKRFATKYSSLKDEQLVKEYLSN
ncbi:MAG: hypothetical protein E7070_10105 [Bacteroidales bacterium]|nr:hypothetical protein [Bacteroidales bacterium]